MAGDVTQVLKCLSRKHKALISNPGTAKKKKQNKTIKYLQTEFNNTLKSSYTMIKLVSFQGFNYCSTHKKNNKQYDI
jgi:hypothetical protein